MENEVARAALAIVKPATDPASRREASKFLEEWTKTSEAWDVYTKWLASYRQHDKSRTTTDENGSYHVPMQLLCLTMLQSKLRHEMTVSNAAAATKTNQNGISALRIELWEYLRQQPVLDRSLLGPCCICNAITIVRSEGGTTLSEFISNAFNNNLDLPPETVLRLLASIPSEMEARQDLTTNQVMKELGMHLEAVLDLIRRGLNGDNSASTILPACQVLRAWTEIAKISLAQINTPTCGGPHAVLPILIKLLSSPDTNADEMTLQIIAKAMTAVVLITSDVGTSTRQAAAASFWVAISEIGFLVNPLQVAITNEWDDTIHALATLLSTFFIEHSEDIVSRQADIGLQILLEIQSHPSTSVALIPLECWLTIQDIPTAERHEHWTKPLHKNLIEILLRRMAYPIKFTTWENKLEIVDSSEFSEFRRLVADVFVGCYYLLRIEMIQMLTHWVRTATDWRMSESALSALSQISKEVCSRCGSKAPDGTLIARDRQATQQELVQFLEQLITVDTETTKAQHIYLLGAVVNFCGNFSNAWISMDCPLHAMLGISNYLQSTITTIPLEAARAIRALYVSCLAKKMPRLEASSPPSSDLKLIFNSVRNSMEIVLSMPDEEAIKAVTEGSTRLLSKIENHEMARKALTTDLIQPIIDRIDTALKAMPQSNIVEEWMSLKVQSATESLARYLAAIRIMSRFCNSSSIPAMAEWMVHMIVPYLKVVQQRTASTPAQSYILEKWISIHQQILRKSFPEQNITITIFTNTISFMVELLEQTREPSTLKYITTAVEVLGGQMLEMDKSFQDLLVHITEVTMWNNNLREATELLEAYFDCLQRYTLFCPRALCYNPKLSEIISVAIGAVSSIDAKDTTRAALVFLSQLLGWHTLRLSPQTTQVLQEAWNSLILKEIILRQGQNLIVACFTGLSGGSQMIWPAYSDCVFAIVQAITTNETECASAPVNPADTISPLLNESLIREWLFSAMTTALSPQSARKITSEMNSETINQMIPILLALARNGPNSRTKAKMLLTDYAKIKKGEMNVDSFSQFSLP